MSRQLSQGRGTEKPSVVAPDGAKVEIPEEVFAALEEFVLSPRPTGSLTIHFRNGGVVGIEALIKKVYK
jgi:hypothetical protein